MLRNTCLSDMMQRFPTWMWRNATVKSFLEWMRDYNSKASFTSVWCHP